MVFNIRPKYKINSHSLYNSVRTPKPNDMNEIVPIRMSSQDKKKLQERADANRLKLSTYLRHQLTKNLRDE